MEEGVLALAPDGVIRVTNRAAREVLGLSHDAKAPHISRVPRRELRAGLEAALQTSIRTRAVNVADRIVMIEANLLEDGLAIVSLRDVTDVRRLEEVRTDFVANASHELKTPLTAVRGFAETLLEDDVPPEVRQQFLGLIHDNTLRLQAIVEDLLDLSRLESGGWTPSTEPIDVVDTVHQAWAEVVEMRGSSRTFEVSGEAAVVADQSGLLHVLRNLFDNALRHTPETGTIHIRLASHADDQVRITVEDDGSGIPPDALPRIFERFFRVDRARSRAHGGTGLGLAIVSHLTSRMGGAVEAESQFGVGTKIHVYLPAAPQIQMDGIIR
jgi:two-component system phosphate regulon sensor histidine kinase PhoR